MDESAPKKHPRVRPKFAVWLFVFLGVSFVLGLLADKIEHAKHNMWLQKVIAAYSVEAQRGAVEKPAIDPKSGEIYVLIDSQRGEPIISVYTPNGEQVDYSITEEQPDVFVFKRIE